MSGTLRGAYRVPIVALVASVAGLILALVVDGVGDVVALVAIALPLLLVVRALARAARSRPNTSSSRSHHDS